MVAGCAKKCHGGWSGCARNGSLSDGAESWSQQRRSRLLGGSTRAGKEAAAVAMGVVNGKRRENRRGWGRSKQGEDEAVLLAMTNEGGRSIRGAPTKVAAAAWVGCGGRWKGDKSPRVGGYGDGVSGTVTAAGEDAAMEGVPSFRVRVVICIRDFRAFMGRNAWYD